MGLLVTRLVVENFRSYDRLELELDPRLTILVGPNAVGKTNIVEAVQLLTAAESFRRPLWSDLIKWGSEAARAEMHAEGDGRHVAVELLVTKDGRREYRVNGKTRRRIADVAGTIPSVVFTPDDLRLVKDSAERRRGAIDALGQQISPSYAALKTEYERVVRQRNAALKEERTTAVLQDLTEHVATLGARFVSVRKRLFSKLAPELAKAHAVMTEHSLLVPRYVPSWEKDGIGGEADDESSIRNMLKAKEMEERARKTTLAGPHRDDIMFDLDGRDARVFASQGQQRTIALAWKLGEVAVISQVSGITPILLLDDVMSELDEERRHLLAGFVGEAAQTVVTTTNLGYFEEALVQRASVVRLS